MNDIKPNRVSKEVVKFVQRCKRDAKRLARMKVSSSVGCNHGFRKADVFCSAAEKLSLRVGENNRLLYALIFNGSHPDYQNGREA